MMKRNSSTPRLFTVVEANKTLPLVSAIANDLFPLWVNVSGTRKRLRHFSDHRSVEEGDPYSDELGAMRERLAIQSVQVEALIDELRELGVEFKSSGSQAHVCFPAMLEGRLVYLSWCPGDLDVSHWIEFDAGFDGRQSLMEIAAVD